MDSEQSMRRQPGFFDIHDRLKRLSDLGDQLSDERLSFLINDMLSSMRSWADRAPGARTIWLFREKLTTVEAIKGRVRSSMPDCGAAPAQYERREDFRCFPLRHLKLNLARDTTDLSRILVLLCASVLPAQDSGDLRDLRIGMSITAIPQDEYVDLSCAETPEQTLVGWSDFGKCPRDAIGLRTIGFHFNDRLNPLAEINDKYQGTRVAGHPIVLTLLIDEGGMIEGLRIDTDPQALSSETKCDTRRFDNRHG
jgi:hypothetical protein